LEYLVCEVDGWLWMDGELFGDMSVAGGSFLFGSVVGRGSVDWHGCHPLVTYNSLVEGKHDCYKVVVVCIRSEVKCGNSHGRTTLQY
jgi:hypothetical protein